MPLPNRNDEDVMKVARDQVVRQEEMKRERFKALADKVGVTEEELERQLVEIRWVTPARRDAWLQEHEAALTRIEAAALRATAMLNNFAARCTRCDGVGNYTMADPGDNRETITVNCDQCSGIGYVARTSESALPHALRRIAAEMEQRQRGSALPPLHFATKTGCNVPGCEEHKLQQVQTGHGSPCGEEFHGMGFTHKCALHAGHTGGHSVGLS